MWPDGSISVINMSVQTKMQQQVKYREMFYEDDAEVERQRALRLKNKRNGVAIFQATWILAFVCLAAVNLLLRSSSREWPPLGVERLNPTLPSIVTLLLIASAFFVRRGVTAISADGKAQFLVQWRTALSLGAVFFVVMAYEWLTVTPLPEMRIMLANEVEVVAAVSQYNAIFRVMTAFHVTHALVIGVYMLNVIRGVRRGEVNAADFWPAEAGAKLWYFVIVAWMIFYAVLYWL